MSLCPTWAWLQWSSSMVTNPIQFLEWASPMKGNPYHSFSHCQSDFIDCYFSSICSPVTWQFSTLVCLFYHVKQSNKAPYMARTEESLFCLQCTQLSKQVSFFFRSIKLVFNKIAQETRGLELSVIDYILVTPEERFPWLNLIKNHFQI